MPITKVKSATGKVTASDIVQIGIRPDRTQCEIQVRVTSESGGPAVEFVPLELSSSTFNAVKNEVLDAISAHYGVTKS